jgi:hypothetical protein
MHEQTIQAAGSPAIAVGTPTANTRVRVWQRMEVQGGGGGWEGRTSSCDPGRNSTAAVYETRNIVYIMPPLILCNE